MTRSILVVTALAVPALAQQVVFDLADAVGMGNGTLPGTGTVPSYPQATAPGQFVPAPPGYPAVLGSFVPSHTGPTTVAVLPNNTAITFDFTLFPGQIASSTPGVIGNGMAAWNLSDPSGVGQNPNYTGRPEFHSIMACTANAGVTFDLAMVRSALGTTGNLELRTMVGSADVGPISWFATTINNLGAVAWPSGNGGLANGNFDSLSLLLSPTDDYLVLAISDSGVGSTAGADGYWGDPFIVPTCTSGWILHYGNGCPDSSGLPYIGARGVHPCIGRSIEIGAVFPSGLGYALAIGLSDSTYLGVTLPFALAPVGAHPSCHVFASTESVSGLTPSASTLPLTIPSDISFSGLHLFAQAFTLDPALTTALPVALTEALHLQVGF